MYNFKELSSSLSHLAKSGLSENLPYIIRGMEKEGLRQTEDGQLAQTPHPEKLGAALTNKYITTDYSEALLEFITPVFKDSKKLHSFLVDLHAFTCQNLDKDESLWCHSMPCKLTEEKNIPIADYGSSNLGLMKHIYRRGLAWRYTRRMQTIAGIHFNFSYPDEFWTFLHQQEKSSLSIKDFKSEKYFGLIRNFQRYVWLLFYFTGSSPALCKSFLSDQNHSLDSFDDCTAYLPYATSLRMSDLGYTNNEQQTLDISFNSIEEYTEGLSQAINCPSAEFNKIGTKVDGEYRQLNDNILQIENEFYSIIRPKRSINRGEKPTVALQKRGVEYIEIRMLDINPFDPTGISLEQIHFLDIFMLSCLLAPSPAITSQEKKIIQTNQNKAILEGRNPDLKILGVDGKSSFKSLAKECFKNLKETAVLLDQAHSSTHYVNTLNHFAEILDDSSRTPSGKILADMQKQNCSYYPYAKRISSQHNTLFQKHSIKADLYKSFEDEALNSHKMQQKLEAEDDLSFEAYLENYFAQ